MAVLIVIAYHFKIPGFSGGFLGVDIFFVISGYLIASQINNKLLTNTFSFKVFFESRLRRIFPALVVVVLFSFIAGWIFELPGHFISSSKESLSAIFYVSNHAFNNSDYFARASESKPLLHTWSLSIEGQFYLWLALGYFFAYKYCRKWIPSLIATLIIFSFLYASYVAYKNINGFYLITARAWELLAGVSLINIKQRTNKKPFFLLLALSLIFSATMIFNEELTWPTYFTILPIVAAAMFIYYGEAFKKNILISNRFMQVTGNISYSLYLIHWPICVFAFQYFENQISPFIKISLIAVTFMLAFISYHSVEKPFRNKQLISTKRFYIFLLIAIIASTLLFLITVKNKGFPLRFPGFVLRGMDRSVDVPKRECFRNAKNTKKAKDQFCTFGKSNDPKDATAILWGDSHANQYLTPISNAANFVHLTGLIANMSGCVPSLNFQPNDINKNSYCNDFNKEVSTYILSDKKINILILGMHWNESNVDNAISVVNKFIKDGRKIILIGPLPKPGFNVANHWANIQIKGGRQIDEIVLPNSPEVKQSRILEKLIQQLEPSISKGNLIIIDPSSEYCDKNSCYVVKDGQAIFKDTHHLTELSARRMQSYFISALKQLRQ